MNNKPYKKKEAQFRLLDLKTALLLKIGEKSEANITQGGPNFRLRSIVEAIGTKQGMANQQLKNNLHHVRNT